MTDRVRVWECQTCGAVRADAVRIEANPDDHWSAEERACEACGSLQLLVVEGFHCAICARLVRARGHEHL